MRTAPRAHSFASLSTMATPGMLGHQNTALAEQNAALKREVSGLKRQANQLVAAQQKAELLQKQEASRARIAHADLLEKHGAEVARLTAERKATKRQRDKLSRRLEEEQARGEERKALEAIRRRALRERWEEWGEVTSQIHEKSGALFDDANKTRGKIGEFEDVLKHQGDRLDGMHAERKEARNAVRRYAKEAAAAVAVADAARKKCGANVKAAQRMEQEREAERFEVETLVASFKEETMTLVDTLTDMRCMLQAARGELVEKSRMVDSLRREVGEKQRLLDALAAWGYKCSGSPAGGTPGGGTRSARGIGRGCGVGGGGWIRWRA